jgi:hypothetical protein
MIAFIPRTGPLDCREVILYRLQVGLEFIRAGHQGDVVVPSDWPKAEVFFGTECNELEACFPIISLGNLFCERKETPEAYQKPLTPFPRNWIHDPSRIALTQCGTGVLILPYISLCRPGSIPKFYIFIVRYSVLSGCYYSSECY